MQLTLKDFDYELPANLIAHEPEIKRDHSRLFIRQRNGTSQHTLFHKIIEHLPEKTLLIVNDSKVFASRLIGQLSTGGKVEIFLLNKPVSAEKAICQVLAKPMKKLKTGTIVYFNDDLSATVVEKTNSEVVEPISVEFNCSTDQLLSWTNKNGYVPLPPYIERKTLETCDQSKDTQTYQTVYANNSQTGSVAAPTAGLHFTDALIEQLKQKNIELLPVTLHVGAGTFMPVKHENIDAHIMHKEWHLVPSQTIKKILQAKKSNTPIVAVGTTSLRALESLYRNAKSKDVSLESLGDEWFETDLFLRPKNKSDIYKPWIIDGLITNFHQPCSTLFMLICNLIGFDAAHQHYREAIKEQYRFFSYGDSNLFWLNETH